MLFRIFLQVKSNKSDNRKKERKGWELETQNYFYLHTSPRDTQELEQ